MAKLRTTNESTDAPPSAKLDRRARKRVSIYLDESGAPDWTATPKSVLDQLGLGPGGTPEPEPEPIPIEVVGVAIGMLANVESAIVSRQMGIPLDMTRAALTPPPPIAGALNEAAARVLNKYSGAWSRWADEIMLGGLIVTWQLQAFSELRAIKAEMMTKEERSAPPPPPKTEPEPETTPFPDAIFVDPFPDGVGS